VEEIGAAPFLLIVPTYRDIRILRERPDAEISRLDLALETFCEKKRISFLNLSHAMVRWKGDFESLWLADGHFSPEGHRWVAEALLDALLSGSSGDTILNVQHSPRQ